MGIVISILKARLAALAIANAAVHLAALAGKGYAWLDPQTVGTTFDAVASVVVLGTGTIAIFMPQIKKKIEFTDTEGIVK